MSSDYYVKMDPIKGESTDDKHADWIEALDFSASVSNAAKMGSGQGGLGVSRADLSDVNFSKFLDKSSSDLNFHCATGTHIKEVLIQCCLTSGEKDPYLEYKLEDVVVSNISISGHGGGDQKPTENVSLAFGKITWKYTDFGHDGKKGSDHEKFYDLKTNTGG